MSSEAAPRSTEVENCHWTRFVTCEDNSSRTQTLMSILVDEYDGSPPAVDPDTNAHELFSVPLDRSDMGFSPTVLAELTAVAHSSGHETVRSHGPEVSTEQHRHGDDEIYSMSV